MPDIRTGDHETVGVDRIGGIGHQDRISRTGRGQRQMRQALFGAQRDDGLAVRVEFDRMPRDSDD